MRRRSISANRRDALIKLNGSVPIVLAGLSPREKEVMLLLVDGVRAKEVARRLKVDFRTVGGLMKRALKKTGHNGVVLFARAAQREGLIK